MRDCRETVLLLYIFVLLFCWLFLGDFVAVRLFFTCSFFKNGVILGNINYWLPHTNTHRKPRLQYVHKLKSGIIMIFQVLFSFHSLPFVMIRKLRLSVFIFLRESFIWQVQILKNFNEILDTKTRNCSFREHLILLNEEVK